MKRSLLLCLAAVALSSAAGCVDTDATVFVDPSISEPQVLLTSAALGTALSGDFVLSFHLGPRASGASEVTLQGFSLTDENQETTFVASLPVNAAATFPLTVGVGKDVSVDVSFSTEPDSGIDANALCGGTLARIVGSIQDSLQDGATPVTSEPFGVGCTL
ncbi:hypothetical protein [Chondromyces apiculatus]|uniref:Lipoprotein n=1 Tax=Chondromyces apiculatus DSM 436 TaxID=1192034 RepID=A0A017TBZ8_9BACT|nr:hypothetical protein [Chondromyces apiculatus]EYF06437.1 Hypothetical protein CAP_1967 [Chondromyces apiculatus DSM 436]